MKIFLAGGGTGGHFTPLIAVADALNVIAQQEKIAHLDLVFVSDSPYDKELLVQKGIRFKKISAGKMRRYFSLLNIFDFFKMGWGVFKALFSIYLDFPDVIFSKGGYASFPAVFAARVWGIPLIVHESDTIPGRVNKWSGKFAKRIAISFPSAAQYFPKNKTAMTGIPVRREFLIPAGKQSAREFLGLEGNLQTITVLGGSQGSVKINEIFLDVVPELVKKYQIIHLVGKNNIEDVKARASILLDKSPYQSRYHVFDFLDVSKMHLAYGAADLAVARASGTVIFEFAVSGLPAILVPLPKAAQNHQKENAYVYSASGGAEVIEQNNLSPHLLETEIERILEDSNKLKQMAEGAKKFSKPDAAEKIAREIINLALTHA